MKRIGIVLGIFLMGTVAAFGNPRIVSRSCHVATVVQQVVTPVVQAVAVPVAVVTPIYVPTYSVGYAGSTSYATPAVADGPSPNQMLLEEIKGLRQDFQQLRQAPTPLSQDPPRKESLIVSPGAKAMQARCASCHSGSGKGVVLFRNGSFIDEGDNASRVLEQIHTGKMPKGGKLSDKERYDILWSLTVKETK